MPQIKLTSKRQVTFPKEACDALRVNPGDIIEMESRIVDGEKVYILRPKSHERPWLGCLAGKIKPVTDYSMDAIRESIARGRRQTGE